MYVDPKTGRSILGLWDEEKQQWVLDMQGLVTIKTLAAAARERLEKNPESAGAFLELRSLIYQKKKLPNTAMKLNSMKKTIFNMKLSLQP